MSPHVLIVDDTEDELQLLSTVFKMVDPNIAIETVSNSAGVLGRLRDPANDLPKVILLDLRMPEKSGREVLAEIKADPRLKRTPVCIFSNGDLEADVRECYELGAIFYFKKPMGLAALQAFIRNFNGLWFNAAIL